MKPMLNKQISECAEMLRAANVDTVEKYFKFLEEYYSSNMVIEELRSSPWLDQHQKAPLSEMRVNVPVNNTEVRAGVAARTKDRAAGIAAKAEPVAGPETEVGVKTGPETEEGALAGTATEEEAEAGTAAKAESEVGTEVEFKQEVGTETEDGAKAGTEREEGALAGTAAKAVPEAGTAVKAESEAGTEVEFKREVGTETEDGAKAGPETEDGALAGTAAKAVPEAEGEVEDESQVEDEPNPKLKLEKEPGLARTGSESGVSASNFKASKTATGFAAFLMSKEERQSTRIKFTPNAATEREVLRLMIIGEKACFEFNEATNRTFKEKWTFGIVPVLGQIYTWIESIRYNENALTTILKLAYPNGTLTATRRAKPANFIIPAIFPILGDPESERRKFRKWSMALEYASRKGWTQKELEERLGAVNIDDFLKANCPARPRKPKLADPSNSITGHENGGDGSDINLKDDDADIDNGGRNDSLKKIVLIKRNDRHYIKFPIYIQEIFPAELDEVKLVRVEGGDWEICQHF
ncbi:MAG: hypothetical protein WCJ64_06670 [Rhodospirillaceae bacterium]